MYLLVVNFIKTPVEVAPHVETHSAWVKKNFEEGVFLFAGPKKSKLGGAILARSIDKSLLNKIISEDSYIKEDVAEYQIIDFDCKVTTPELGFLKIA
jgi:uncharacterized protein YciI